MAQITITIPNTVLQRVLDGFCYNQGYSPVLENGEDNPETQAQFAKRKIIEYVKRAVREAEIEQARNTAGTSAGQNVDSDIQLT